MAFREDTHFHFTRALPILRHMLLEAGRRLAGAGVLPEAEDVFHLNLEELEALPGPDHLAAADADRIRTTPGSRGPPRRAGRRTHARHGQPGGSGCGRDGCPGDRRSASGGRVTGPVRVIREPAEFGALRSGDVLVCPYTNPTWTSLFQRTAAVVVDSGGIGSHAAIVAREYGIPAVMGTGTGTRVLADGQQVTVDGDTGRVTAA